MTSLRITLPEELSDFVEAEVAAGTSRDASEFIGQLIRERQVKQARAEVDRLLLEALEGGEAAPFRPSDLDAMVERVRRASRKDRPAGA